MAEVTVSGGRQALHGLRKFLRVPLKGSFKGDIDTGIGIGIGIDVYMDIDAEMAVSIDWASFKGSFKRDIGSYVGYLGLDLKYSGL